MPPDEHGYTAVYQTRTEETVNTRDIEHRSDPTASHGAPLRWAGASAESLGPPDQGAGRPSFNGVMQSCLRRPTRAQETGVLDTDTLGALPSTCLRPKEPPVQDSRFPSSLASPSLSIADLLEAREAYPFAGNRWTAIRVLGVQPSACRVLSPS
jgi:hypothetical protein